VACGTGSNTLEAASQVSPGGEVIGVDLSGRMIEIARGHAFAKARTEGCSGVRFERMDAEELDLPDASFDAVLCALGLMYVPHPERALREMRRVLRPNGRIVLAVWGERAQCGWAELFPIVDAEVASEVCPLFFRLGQGSALAELCAAAEFQVTRQVRLSTVLDYLDDDDACDAAFVGGPVALAWSRLDAAARLRARARYLESIARWRRGRGFKVPGQFVVVAATTAE
jgi:SAM-dependent methyltransferase